MSRIGNNAVASRLRLAEDINVALRDSMPLRIGPGARRQRSSAMRWRPKGSGGAGQSAVLPRLGRCKGIAFVASSGLLPRGAPNDATIAISIRDLPRLLPPRSAAVRR